MNGFLDFNFISEEDVLITGVFTWAHLKSQWLKSWNRTHPYLLQKEVTSRVRVVMKIWNKQCARTKIVTWFSKSAPYLIKRSHFQGQSENIKQARCEVKKIVKLFTKLTPYLLQEKSPPRVSDNESIKHKRCEVKKIVRLFTKSNFRIKT